MSAETEKSEKVDGDAVPSLRVGYRDAGGVSKASRDGGSPSPTESERFALGRRQWRQIAWITVGAIALYAGFRVLPTGTNLNHGDFRTGANPGSLEMCDPANPQFIPVMAVRSPVSMTVTADEPAPQAGREVRGAVRLLTASGKPIGPVDLLVVHTRKLHLLVIDPSLGDYQHLHPEPGAEPGEWDFAFTPKSGGVYRIFADFTPAATGRGLYAGGEMSVSGPEAIRESGGDARETIAPNAVSRGGFVFALRVEGGELRAGEPADLVFTVSREGGGEVPLQPVMDAYAHLVAFDEGRSGFAHLHPKEIDLAKKPDARAPRLTFKITIPQRGPYVVWAQVNLGGTETFVPFPVEVR